MEYQYPIDYTWSTDEIIDVVAFFEVIELAYEKGVSRETIMDRYRRLKEIVPSKSEEKKLFNEFESESGYSSYRTVKSAKEANSGDKIKMK
ncbi:UPF0223 family protein [Mesobacillus maritimus]|uniref:UPF0223 family protein n=1 Tax=Mesobacillus maritimus TaxID=1643336 RepID=UPI00203CADB5|nr:UPF0223 family protein [Mesobacillus maritimus]MCM3587038.1 UPF0223 family protein [Mesobacillus maritimus]MCM3667603.1 UPF0223 family protein [Mesobacillus maritimus]